MLLTIWQQIYYLCHYQWSNYAVSYYQAQEEIPAPDKVAGKIIVKKFFKKTASFILKTAGIRYLKVENYFIATRSYVVPYSPEKTR